ncbi:MAG: RidA family protein [Stappiaceae bacterium]
MSAIEKRIAELGLYIPGEPILPPGLELLFPWVNVRGHRAFISGHAAQNADGSMSGPFGQVGKEVTVEEAVELAKKTALAMLGSLHRELGDLDRISGWGKAFGMVNAVPGFEAHPTVINGFSKVILDVFGPDIGRHSRSAVGMGSLPMNFAVEIEAEVLID